MGIGLFLLLLVLFITLPDDREKGERRHSVCSKPSQELLGPATCSFKLARHHQRRTRTSCDQRFIRPRKRPRSILAFWLFASMRRECGFLSSNSGQLTTGFGVLTIRRRFISEAERSPIYCACSNMVDGMSVITLDFSMDAAFKVSSSRSTFGHSLEFFLVTNRFPRSA